jgi:hypothetical protein
MGTTAKAAASGNSQVGSTVVSGLIMNRVDSTIATKYALVAQGAYQYIQSNPAVQTSLNLYQSVVYTKDFFDLAQAPQTALQAGQLAINAGNLGLSTDGFLLVRDTNVAASLSASIDILSSIAASHGVELNPCALSISKVSLDFAGALGGTATSYTGVGAVIALMSIIAMASDSYSLGTACIDPAIAALKN